jgi:hypothetical protein
MTIETIERGALVVAAPWNDGTLPAPDFALHRWSHREQTGLGVTLCGVRQEDRGNGWVLLEYVRGNAGRFARCEACEEAVDG